MGSDFSALDAELDQVASGPEGPEVDALALASQYAGDLVELAAVDTALAELGAQIEPIEPSAYARDLPLYPSDAGDAKLGAQARSTPPPLPARSPARLESEEIALPSPVVRESDDADKSGELALDAPAPRSGSFALDDGEADVLTANGARDDTIDADEFLEPIGDELRPEAEPLGNGMRSRFGAASQAGAHDDERRSADFAALFEEATRQSSMPNMEVLPEEPYDDTEIFDSAAFVERLEDDESIVDAFTAEELDSAEFDVVVDTKVESSAARQATSSTPPRVSSKPPEKRPSFLGRLFGRKDE